MRGSASGLLGVVLLMSGCTGGGPMPPDPVPLDAAPARGGRPLACTQEIINGYYDSPRFSGPGGSYDQATTLRKTAELLSRDCAVDPVECVRQVIAVVNVNRPPRAHEEGVRVYRSSSACTERSP